MFGIITNPSKTFEQIISRKPFNLGLAIWLFYTFLYLFSLIYLMQSIRGIKYDFDTTFQTAIRLLIHPNTLLKIFGFYIVVLLQNFFAVKYYKFKSSFVELLSCNFFILIVGILNLFLVIVLTAFSAISFINYPMIIFVPWGIILDILAIKIVYKTSTGTALKIFLFAFSILVIFNFVL